MLEKRVIRKVVFKLQEQAEVYSGAAASQPEARSRIPLTHGGSIQLHFCIDPEKIHLHITVVRACARARVSYCIVPAKLTSLLQPRDAHLFAKSKATPQVQVLHGRCG